MLDAALDAVTAARADGRTAVLQAADTRTVRDLDSRAHACGVLDGTVSGLGVVLHDGLPAAVGDRIVTRRNNRRLATADGYARNGEPWDVTAIGRHGSLPVRPAVGADVTVRLPAS